MNVFSKPFKEEILNYHEFFKKQVNLSKMKIPELKTIAKKNKLHVSGKKEVLVERIQFFFVKSRACSVIQKYVRGHLVRYSFILRGPGFRKVEKCVNDTDFVSLEPLKDIDWYDFYSYIDDKGFIYGFSISSLISLWVRKRSLMNPYNRELLKSNIVSDIHTLHRLKDIIWSNYDNTPKQTTNHVVQSVSANRIANIRIHPSSIVNTIGFPNANNRELIERMQVIQQKPLNVRIQELFMEIDNLGNYTQASWFDNLTTNDYIRYMRYLGDIWNHRGQLSSETKRNICSILDPFEQRFFYPVSHDPRENVKQVCMYILEHMIYTGIDVEYRKLGALHALSALTIVSVPARNNMVWLYESLLY